jgi:hypothetical protein
MDGNTRAEYLNDIGICEIKTSLKGTQPWLASTNQGFQLPAKSHLETNYLEQA